MDLEQSSLFREVQAIIQGSSKPVHHTWTAEFHANGETIEFLKVLTVDFRQDYELAYADEIMLTVSMPIGTYSKRMYPYQDNLEITLYRKPLHEASATNDAETEVQSERYAATLVDKGNPMIEGTGAVSLDEATLNLTGLVEVEFQLVNKAVEQMRMMSVGDIFRNCTVEDVLKAVLTKSGTAVKVETSRKPKGVEMVEASNKTKRDHVIIPHGTPLVELPQYIHDKCGVYSSGFNYYYQNDFWYIYPCYDTTRFTKATRTLTVLNIPKDKFPNIERSYRKDGSNLVVLATGDAKFRDNTEAMQLNDGNGVRFADATKFMSGLSTVENNKTVVKRSENNNEFVAEKRKNGNQFVRLSDRAIHANPFVEYSRLAAKQGGVFGFVWENSNPALVFPGMPVKVLYMSGEEIKEIYGVVLKAHHVVQTKGVGLTELRYACASTLSIYVKAPQE